MTQELDRSQQNKIQTLYDLLSEKVELVEKILTLKKQNFSYRAIAKKLGSISHTSVKNIYEDYKSSSKGGDK